MKFDNIVNYLILLLILNFGLKLINLNASKRDE